MHGNSKGKTKGRSRYNNHSNRVVRNMEERNVGTKGKSPKQDLTSPKELTTEISEGSKSLYNKFDQLINLTYSLIYGP